MSSILIKEVTLDDQVKDILIVDNIISKISNDIDYSAETVIKGEKMYAIPGLINMHTHSGMVLMRGVLEDVPLFEWLERVWALEPNLDPEMIYWATKLASLEMIKSGTICFNDQYWMIENSARAVEEMGIRGYLSYVFLDLGDKNKAERQRKECIQMYEKSKEWGDRVHFSISIHGTYTVCEENIRWATDFANEHNLLIHIHVSETETENIDSYKKFKMSPTQHLNSLGVLGENVLAAHCVWLDGKDIEILGENRVNVCHNINSNLKLSSGYKFLYNELKGSGANITIGTDGAASSNNLDILEAIKTASFVQKAWRGDPSALPLKEGLAMATSNGAKALKLNSGVIKEGSLADILLVDTHSSYFTPNINFLGNLIYSANSSSINTTICNGKVLMHNRIVNGEDEIIENASRLANKLLNFKK
jgi:5-methylthioadenosine/S-adenosylhomocysteine deaminase